MRTKARPPEKRLPDECPPTGITEASRTNVYDGHQHDHWSDDRQCEQGSPRHVENKGTKENTHDRGEDGQHLAFQRCVAIKEEEQ